MQLKRAVVCFVTVSGIAMMSVIGQETRTEKSETEAGNPGAAADEAVTSREANEDRKNRDRILRDRYGIGAAEANPGQSEPAYQMDPVLAERYGLAPTGGAADSDRDETASGLYEMDPVLAERYGLTPPGGAAGTGQGAQPPTELRLPADGRRAGTAAPGLAAGILDGEAGGDLNQAIQAYRGVIEDFDARRGDAAQAVFRLGEAYRRLGMAADARLQYARILSEFPDQAELARMSLERISEPVQGFQTGSSAALPPTSAIPTTPESLKTQLALLREELELMEREIRAAERQQDAGVTSFSEVSALKREALGLKRQIAILEGQIDSAESRKRGSEESGDSSFGASGGGFGGGFGGGGLGGGGYVGDASIPAGLRPKSREEQALEAELSMLQARLLKKKAELMDLSARYEGIRGADLTRIPSRYIDDPRYQTLRTSYERAYLRNDSSDALEAAENKMTEWIVKLYLPELKTEIENCTQQVDLLEGMRLRQLEEIRLENNRKTSGSSGEQHP